MHILLIDDHATSRAFLYSAILFGIIFAMVALATTGMRIRRQGRSHLISILGCMTVLPLMLAVPLSEAVPDTRYLNAYVEMVSSLTTTGLTLFEPERLPGAPDPPLWLVSPEPGAPPPVELSPAPAGAGRRLPVL